MLRLFTLFFLALELRTGLLFFQNTRLVNLVPLALRTRNTARLLLTFFWFEGGGARCIPIRFQGTAGAFVVVRRGGGVGRGQQNENEGDKRSKKFHREGCFGVS